MGVALGHPPAPHQVLGDGGVHHVGVADEVDSHDVELPVPLGPVRHVPIDEVGPVAQRAGRVARQLLGVEGELRHDRPGPHAPPVPVLPLDHGRHVRAQLLGGLDVAPPLVDGEPQLVGRAEDVVPVVAHDEAPPALPDVPHRHLPLVPRERLPGPRHHQLAQLRLQEVHQLVVDRVVVAEADREVLYVEDDDLVGVAQEGLDVVEDGQQRVHAHRAVVRPPLSLAAGVVADAEVDVADAVDELAENALVLGDGVPVHDAVLAVLPVGRRVVGARDGDLGEGLVQPLLAEVPHPGGPGAEAVDGQHVGLVAAVPARPLVHEPVVEAARLVPQLRGAHVLLLDARRPPAGLEAVRRHHVDGRPVRVILVLVLAARAAAERVAGAGGEGGAASPAVVRSRVLAAGRAALAVVRGALAVVRGTLAVVRGTLAVVRDALSVVRSALSVVRGALSIVRGTLAAVRDALSVVGGALSVVRHALAVVRRALAAVRGAFVTVSAAVGVTGGTGGGSVAVESGRVPGVGRRRRARRWRAR